MKAPALIPLFLLFATLATRAENQVWSDSKRSGAYGNFSGTWSETGETWADSKGSDLVAFKGDSTAFFGGNGQIPASPEGEFTVTLDGAQSAGGIRQVSLGAGNYTLSEGSINITSPNGVRVDQGTFTINSTLLCDRDLIIYLSATKPDAVLVLGGDNHELKNGSVCLNGNPGVVRLTSATALGRGSGSLELLSNPKNDSADTLDINGLTVKQGRTLLNRVPGEGTAALVNNHPVEPATFQDNIRLRVDTLLAFGGTGAGLTLTGLIDGDGVLYTTGPSSVTLTNFNTYSGGTVIGEGSTLVLDGRSESATGTGPITVRGRGTLAGTGVKVAVAGPVVTAAPESTISPAGKGAGKLILNGGLDLEKGGTIAFDLGNNTTTTDALVIGDGAEFKGAVGPGPVTFAFTRKAALAGSYVLIDFTGAKPVGLDVAAFKAAGVPGKFRLSGNKLEFSPSSH